MYVCTLCDCLWAMLPDSSKMMNADDDDYDEVSNAPNTLVSGEKPGFQALPKGLIVLLCAEIVRQGVPDHGAVHSECSASNSG